MTDPYKLRPWQPDDEQAVLDLLATTMGGGPTGERTAAFFRWKHLANPFGRSLALVAEHDEDGIIGFRTFMRWRFLSDDKPVRAVRAVDTATHPRHQGRGVFKRLTLAALERASADTDLVFNTPNDQSRPGYLKMGWQPVAPVPVAVRVLRPLRFLLGIRNAGELDTRPVEAPSRLPPADRLLRQPQALDELLRRAMAGTGARLRTDLTVDYLRWRYGIASGLDYRTVAVWGSSGKLVGALFGRARRRGPLIEFTLTETLCAPDDENTLRRLLRAATRAGTDHVAAHLTPATAAAKVGPALGYLPVHRRGPTLVTRPLHADVPVDPTKFESWYLSLGDIELF